MSSFLRALRGENTPVAPIWIMRQAGRHLPEYRALKEKHTFWELARTPELAAEVTLQPIRRYGLDAAILFSDIMTPLPAMGLDLDFRPGPVLAAPVRSRAAVDALRVPASEEIAPFVSDAIRLIRSEAKVPLIGFGGAPLTLATYVVQGAGSKEYDVFRAFLKAEPVAAHALLEKLTEVSVRYLSEQVRAGAQAIQLFDSWAGLHDEATYRTFGLPYAARVLEALEPFGVPRITIAVGASHLYPALAELPVEALSVDWRVPLDRVRPLVGGKTLQGNLDPAALLAPPEALEGAARMVLRAGLGGAHVFNLGHGILPNTDPGAVARLVDVVRAFDRQAEGAAGAGRSSIAAPGNPAPNHEAAP
ncbi:MAG: uroporphyrinogen decarboxylase [Trueperaceae bacterium]